MPELFSLNGNYIRKSEATVSPMDRGMLFGDGLYEVVRIIDNDLHCLDGHVDRFFDGIAGLEIRVPFSREEFSEEAKRIVRDSDIGCGLLYWQLTRGSYDVRSHHYMDHMTSPTYFLSTSKFDLMPTKPEQRFCKVITLPDLRWMKCCYKTVNLVPNCIARSKAHRVGAFEAILYRSPEHVTEGAGSSAFIVRDGEVWTHPTGDLILPGVTRAYVLGLCSKLGIPYKEKAYGLRDLMEADEVFLTGTGVEVLPVVNIEGRLVGNGKAGPVTSSLLTAYLREIGQV